MKFTFENQGTNTFLVYEIGANDELDTMSLGMLTNNSIPGFAAASFTQMDTTKYIKYNVSAKVSAAQLFSGAVNKKRLVGVFSGIVDAMLAAEDYMLDTNSILLDLEYIFADVSTCETVVVCLPVMNLQQTNPNLSMFFKNIIFNTQFDQTENCDHVAQILNYLNSNPVLSLSDFRELLAKVAKGTEAVSYAPVQAAPAAPVQPAPAAPVQTAPVAPVQTNPAPQPAAPAKPAAPAVNVPQQPVQKPAATNQIPAKQPQASNKIDMNTIPNAPQVDTGKKMSMFYLLQHYNKENAAIYKAQQEAKKTQKPQAPQVKAKPEPAKAKAPAKQPTAGFAVPGKTEPAASFAIPGQQTPVMPAQPAVTPKPQPQPQPVVQKPEPVVQAPAYQPPVYQQPIQPSNPINFGETTVLGGGMMGETTVLGGGMAAPVKNDPHLIRSKNNEKIPLNKPVFRIGKERSYVDYFIGDNTAISRSHANIVNHNGEFFVVDTNSTNHTYVNGGMIHSNEEVRLSHGTIIRLANEDFEFKLY